MNMDVLLGYIDVYGYAIIFLFLFLGIVGIPAPEESLLFLIGILAINDKLSLTTAALCAWAGAFVGMAAAYACGRYVGYPFITKYGKYVGITEERWLRTKEKYTGNVKKTVILGFYLPGLRQISPYFAGISRVSFGMFILYSFLGSIFWTLPFILGGYYAGSLFDINPNYVPYVGVGLLILFCLYSLIKYFRGKKEKKSEGVH
ncbi:DedA family protein [Peribacillus saganii]|uniref:DedA family protein n=1 Tax=Peribacillus saganii TaxID=2303992 RepID=A0A372LNK4_9BACI|nr:DedA family protein [Peribacillus saganii]RFU69150.1 DedA family protein [Peribacillus saganii]